MGVDLGPPAPCGEITLPNGASWADGLEEDEAVLIALWNNAAFREALVEMKLAHADLVQAGLLPNPEFLYFFPVSDKPFKYAAEFPLEALWLRPIRVAAAEREQRRVRDRLVQLGLDLIRDARVAYADLSLAHGRYRVAEQAVQLNDQLAALAEARLQAGDISVQEARTARINALAAQQERTRVGYDRDWAEERLRQVMGLGELRESIVLHDPRPPLRTDLDVDWLVQTALVDRPDVQSAAAAVAAAAERARLSKLVWFRFLGVADATSSPATGHELGPAFRVTVPIFNWNQGAVARAEAELEQAVRRQTTLRNQIILDLRQAHVRYHQALAEWQVLQGQVRPEVEGAVERADAAYRAGDTSYLVALQTTQQLIDARLREEQLLGDLRRSWAELERNVGRRIETVELLPLPPLAEAAALADDSTPAEPTDDEIRLAEAFVAAAEEAKR